MASSTFEGLVIEARDALDRIVKGDPNGYKDLYSRADDVTLGNPFGGFARGFDEVVETLERAASYFRDGATTGFETLIEHVSDGIAYTVEIERTQAKVGGAAEISPIALRVTCVYRLETEGWKLLHRHADPRVDLQKPESVLQR